MEPSDEELLQAARDADLLMPDGSTGYLESADLSELVLAFARAVLTHWGNYPAQPDSSPAPPAEGEVAELARWLRMQGEAQKPGPNSLLSGRTTKEHHAAGVRLTRAADLLEQRHPAPPAEGEVADLIAWLGDEADQYDCIQQAPETARRLRRAADLFAQCHPAPPAEGEVGELVAFLLWHASGLGHSGHGKRGRLLLTRAANLLSQRHPAPVPEEAVNPWKDALIDALVCNFLLTTENESDPKKALHDLISWETRLAMDPSINPLMRPVPVSERLPRPEDCDGERNCWQWIPDISGHYPLGHWELQHRDWVSDPDGDATHWLPATTLPLPAGEVQP